MPAGTSDPPDAMNTLPYVVAIGASAGGVEATTRLLKTLPRDLPAAVVVVTHRPARLADALPTILARATELRVRPAVRGASLEPGVCHVAPPEQVLWVKSDGSFDLVEDGFYRVHRIDACFHSLALHAGRRTVGVVLSGTLADGAMGLRAIREAGGMTLVQALNDAEFGDMPRTAIAIASPVDLVGTAEALGYAICRHVEKACLDQQ